MPQISIQLVQRQTNKTDIQETRKEEKSYRDIMIEA